MMMITDTRVFPALDDDAQLLPSKVPQGGAVRLHNLVLPSEVLRISGIWSRMGKKHRLEAM
jgi:hypothetical protein